MKPLYMYLEETVGAATPLNTVGMGNPMPPAEGQVGSEPLCAKCKKEKKNKKKEKGA